MERCCHVCAASDCARRIDCSALWSGLLYSILGILNPILEKHIDWWWFAASRRPLESSRHRRYAPIAVRTHENLPFVLRGD